jgi:electron transfer flavoprotein beta subunit
MKILVAVKRVIDYNVKIRVKQDGSGVETNNVKMSINPFDEIAVEEALRLKEKGIATEIIVTSIGPKSCIDIIRHALALGADRGIHIETETPTEPLGIAKALQKLVNQESPSLIILGKQAIDDDCNQVGQMLSALLSWPQGTFASSLNIDATSQKATVVREIDGGLETVCLSLPAVITTDLRLNTPRYATLPNIMKAKQKPISTLTAAELEIDFSNHLTLLKVREPESRKAGIKLDSVADLVAHIKKVI